jgi:hypothetical protein
MSTRSNIAIEDEKGKIHAIYVHSDGYPNGVGHCLLNHYSSFKVAKELFKFGNASSLGSTLKDCSFYARDWGRDEEKARTYNNEWSYLNEFNGDIFIEYVYLFKKNEWFVSSQESMKAPKDFWDDDKRSSVPYLTKLVRIEEHRDYKPEKIDHDQPTEKEMVAQIGKLLSDKGWGPDNIMVQGGSVNKKKFN